MICHKKLLRYLKQLTNKEREQDILWRIIEERLTEKGVENEKA